MHRTAAPRTLRLFAVVALAASLVACGSYPYKPFNLMDEKQPPRVTSVAVIAGSPSDGPVQLAELVTKGLKEKTKLRVLSQEEIGQRAANYPFPIRLKPEDELTKNNKNEKMVWFDPAEQAKLNALQARLKTDGLLVLWVPWIKVYSNNQGVSTFYVWPSGNMLTYPGGKVVASTKMSRAESNSILALFRSRDYYIVKALEKSAKDIVDEFIAANPSIKK